MAGNYLTAQRLRELFSYDPDAGSFTRLAQRGPSKAGLVAPCKDAHGYEVLRVDYRLHRAHRLVWLHVHGAWPVGDIDHIDGNRANNRIANLRDVTRAENNQNQRSAASHNAGGVLGVSPVHKSSRYRARIAVNGESRHLGCYATEEEAHAAYLDAKSALHPAGTLKKTDAGG